MTRPPVAVPLLATLLLAAWCLPATAADDMTPRPQRVIADKPRIEDYADYNSFLVDIMEFRRQKLERETAAAAAKAAAPSTSTEDPSLYRINGPESLDDALARASRLPHPVYAEPERFGRSTSFSFPIPQMEGDDMSANEVPGRLTDLETLQPDIYEDETALNKAESDQKESPTGDEKVRATRALQGSNEAYQISYQEDGRLMTDSDGRTRELPLLIKNEVGYTVIRHIEVEVTTFKN